MLDLELMDGIHEMDAYLLTALAVTGPCERV